MITTESIKKYTMPCAIMRNLVAFPGIPMTIDMDKGPAKKIFETAAKEGTPVFIVCQKDPMEEAISIAKELMEKGKPASMAAKEAAKLTGQTKGEVYKRLMEEEEE